MAIRRMIGRIPIWGRVLGAIVIVLAAVLPSTTLLNALGVAGGHGGGGGHGDGGHGDGGGHGTQQSTPGPGGHGPGTGNHMPPSGGTHHESTRP